MTDEPTSPRPAPDVAPGDLIAAQPIPGVADVPVADVPVADAVETPGAPALSAAGAAAPRAPSNHQPSRGPVEPVALEPERAQVKLAPGSIRMLSSLPALRRIRWLVLGAFAILLPLAVFTSRSRIENEIDASVRTVLDRAGYSAVQVDVTGQDVTLRGVVASQAEKDEAKRLAAGRLGVRAVDAEGVSVDDSAPAATQRAVVPTGTDADSGVTTLRRPTHIAGKVAGSTLTVAATVSDEETKRALLSKVTATLAPDALVDEVTVDPADGTSDLDAHEAMGDFLAELILARFDDVSFDYDNGSLLLNARVPEATRVDALRSIGLGLVGDPVKLQADIAVETAPTATDAVGNTTTTLPAPTTTVAMSAELVVSSQTALASTIAGRTIGFEPSSARIDDAGKQVVAEVAAAIKAIPSSELRFLVAGYTDTSGSAAGNRRISQRRASAVKEALVQAGITSRRIDASGFGAAKPIADNATAEGRIKNRRIEITVIVPDGIDVATTTAAAPTTSAASPSTTAP